MKKILTSMLVIVTVACLMAVMISAAATGFAFSTDGLDGWLTPGATWVIADESGTDILSQTDGAGWQSINSEDAFEDFVLTTKIKFLTPGGQFYMYFRANYPGSITDAYRLVWLQDKIQFEKDEGGVRSYPEETAFTTEYDVWYDLKIVADGSDFEFWVDNVKVLEFEDTYRTEGIFALASWAQSFKMQDITITEPGAASETSSTASSITSTPAESEAPQTSDASMLLLMLGLGISGIGATVYSRKNKK